MDEKTRILLIEDDFKLAGLVREFLEGHGFEVCVEGRGDKAVDRILTGEPDMVILDLMLPGVDGLSICREVRPSYSGPILMLTALGEEVDEIVGLEVGADDYVTKPIKPRLLLARIQTLLRRRRHWSAVEDGVQRFLDVGPLSIDRGSRSASIGGRDLELTTAEFDLMEFLAAHVGEPMTRDDIYGALRGMEWDGLDRSVDLRIARLRRKLGDDAKNPRLIKSVRGTGYMLVKP